MCLELRHRTTSICRLSAAISGSSGIAGILHCHTGSAILFLQDSLCTVQRRNGFQAVFREPVWDFFVDMGIMGLWHGITPSYILYGLYHGALLAATETYQKKSSFYKKNRNKTWYQILSWAITMQLVMFGFSLFSGKLMAVLGW